MPALIWALVCSRVIIDQQTNSISYIDAVDQFGVSDFPAEFPHLFLATLWGRGGDSEDLKVRIRMLAPDGKELISTEPPPIKMPRPRHRLNMNLAGPVLSGPGRYEITIEEPAGAEWKCIAVLPVEVGLLMAVESKPEASSTAPRSRRKDKK
jgi:hypothetical protein